MQTLKPGKCSRILQCVFTINNYDENATLPKNLLYFVKLCWLIRKLDNRVVT